MNPGALSRLTSSVMYAVVNRLPVAGLATNSIAPPRDQRHDLARQATRKLASLKSGKGRL